MWKEFGLWVSSIVTNKISDADWQATTWEGNRREQLQRTLKFTLRERLQAVEDMAEVARRFEEMRLRRSVADQQNAVEFASHDSLSKSVGRNK